MTIGDRLNYEREIELWEDNDYLERLDNNFDGLYDDIRRMKELERRQMDLCLNME